MAQNQTYTPPLAERNQWHLKCVEHAHIEHEKRYEDIEHTIKLSQEEYPQWDKYKEINGFASVEVIWNPIKEGFKNEGKAPVAITEEEIRAKIRKEIQEENALAEMKEKIKEELRAEMQPIGGKTVKDAENHQEEIPDFTVSYLGEDLQMTREDIKDMLIRHAVDFKKNAMTDKLIELVGEIKKP